MRHDPDVAGVFEFECATHYGPLTSLLFSRTNCCCFCHKKSSTSLSINSCQHPLTAVRFTSDSARTPCWLPPSGERLPSFKPPPRAHFPHKSIHPKACPPSFCRHARANTVKSSESPVIAAGTDSLPPEPDSSPLPHAAFSLPAAASHSQRPS